MSLFYLLDVYDDTLTPNTSQTEMLLFGICEDKRVCIRVTDTPFCLFVQVPDDFDDLDKLKNDINAGVKPNIYKCQRTNCCASVDYVPKKSKSEETEKTIVFMCTHPCVHKIKNDRSLTTTITDAKFIQLRSCVGYFPKPKKFVQLTLSRPFLSNQVCKFLYSYMKTNKWNGGEEVCDVFNDATTAFCYSYEKQTEICTGSVIDLASLKKVQTQKTICDEEYLVSYKNLVISNQRLPPPVLKTISFDIETSVRQKTSISSPDKDEILLITCSYEEKDYGFTWGGFFTDVKEITVYKSEREMLHAFLLFIKKINPDVFTGHNCNAFDWEFILVRAKMLGVPFMTELSRLKNFSLIYLNAQRQSEGKGSYTVTYIHCPGRIFHDMYPYMKQLPQKRTSYKLDDICEDVLKEKKLDFDVKKNNEVFFGNDKTKRDEFFQYGLKDSRLALMLYNKTKALNNVLLISKIVGMTVRQWLLVGVQEQLRQLARRFFWPRGVVVPKHDVVYGPVKKTIIPYYEKLPILCKYEGGMVLEPVPGRYTDPVITLDIKSSYPSNMRSANLCISTVCEPETPGAIKYSTGYWFVSDKKQKGLFPEILELLMKERNDAKALMAEALESGNKYMADIYDITQNGLKIVANSLYGTTGAPDSIFNCPYAATTTTARGRECLQMLLDFMKREGLEVLYGDTDSIFAVLRGKTPAETIAIGKALAKKINSEGILPNLVEIDFENYKLPFLITKKKKYMSINYTSLDKPGKLSQKGTIAVMSDNAPIAARIFTSLTKMLMDVSCTLDEIELFLRSEIYKIMNFDAKIEDFIIAQTFKQELHKYKDSTKQVHLQVLGHWNKWSPSTTPKVGDKIPYLIARIHNKKAKMGDRVRPPFLIKSIKEIDVEVFVKQKLQKPISNLLSVAGFDKQRIKNMFEFPYTYDKTKSTQLLGENTIDVKYLDLYKPALEKQRKITDMFKHI